MIPLKVRTEESGDQGGAELVKRETKVAAVFLSFVCQGWESLHTKSLAKPPLALLRIILDRYLVVVVDVCVVKELLRESTEKTRSEQILQTRFVLSHQTITICIQTIKDSL